MNFAESGIRLQKAKQRKQKNLDMKKSLSSLLNRTSNLPTGLFHEEKYDVASLDINETGLDMSKTDFNSHANFHEELLRDPMPAIDNSSLEETVPQLPEMLFSDDQTTSNWTIPASPQSLLENVSLIKTAKTPLQKTDIDSVNLLNLDLPINEALVDLLRASEKRDPIPQVYPQDPLTPNLLDQPLAYPPSAYLDSPSVEVRRTAATGLLTTSQSFSAQDLNDCILPNSGKKSYVLPKTVNNAPPPIPVPQVKNMADERFCKSREEEVLAIVNKMKDDEKLFLPKAESSITSISTKSSAESSDFTSVGCVSIRENAIQDNIVCQPVRQPESRRRKMPQTVKISKRKRLDPEEALGKYGSLAFDRLNPREFTSGTTVCIALAEAIRNDRAEKVENIDNTWQVKETASKGVARDWAQWVGSSGKAQDPWPNFSAKIRNSIHCRENLFEKTPKNDGSTPVNRCFTFGPVVVNLINQGVINISPLSVSAHTISHASPPNEPKPEADDSHPLLPPESN